MTNSLSEGFIRQTYAWGNSVHHAIFPINFAGTPTPGSSPTLTTKSGGTVSFEDGLADLLAVYKRFFNATTIFGLAEIYAVNPTTQERTFIYGLNAALTGSDPSANVHLGMATMSFKTIAGGLLKMTFMEGVLPVNTAGRPPWVVDSREDAITDYLCGDDGIVVGRDDSYPFSSIAIHIKTSDALRKREGL